MNLDIRAILLAATCLAGSGAVAGAAERQGEPAARERGAAPATSVGAGGLTGSGATQDGARRTDGNPAPPAAARGGASAPAAGTTR